MQEKPPITDIYDVIAAMGNNENKTLVFSAMDPGLTYTQDSLHKRHLAIQGEEIVWKMGVASPISYAVTFATVGLVAKDMSSPEGLVAYQRSEKGNYYVHLAGHLLGLSLAEEPSLFAYAGPTFTRSEAGIRPSRRRVEVMRLLLASGGRAIRMADLADGLQVSINHAGSISEAMNAHGIINKSSTGRGKPSLTFMGTPELLTMALRHDSKEVLTEVVRVLQESYSDDPSVGLTNEDIAKRMIARGYPETDLTKLIKQVAKKTHLLAHGREVLVARREVGESVVARETVSADEEKLRRIARYLAVIDGVIAGDAGFVRAGNDLANAIINDPVKVRKLIVKAKQDSLGLKSTDARASESMLAVTEILKNAPAPISRREIREQLQLRGRILDRLSVARYVNTLTELGALSVTEGRSGYLYSYLGEASS